MSTTFVTIQLDPGHRNYGPGETLAGRFRWDCVYPDKVQSVELSVLWYTEGKGDEDFGVHYFEELDVGSTLDVGRSTLDVQSRDASSTPNIERPTSNVQHRTAWRPFATKLPQSPLSYDGALVKIRWCVRVRVFLQSGKEVMGEKVFRLGGVQSVAAQHAGAEAVSAQSFSSSSKRASPTNQPPLADTRMETSDW